MGGFRMKLDTLTRLGLVALLMGSGKLLEEQA